MKNDMVDGLAEFEKNLKMALQYEEKEQFIEFVGSAIHFLSTRGLIDHDLGQKIIQKMKRK